MKITNNHNLPEQVYSLICKEMYDSNNPSDYSATTLLRSPRQHFLTVRHNDAIVEDAMDRVWILLGNAVHDMLDRHSDGMVDMQEERLYVDVLGKCISGKVDCYHDGVITDYKVTSAYSIGKADKIKEWTEQLNIYAYILGKNGKTVTQLQIIALLRDWSAAKAKGYNYPSTNLMVIPLTLWTEKQQEEYITSRVKLFIANEMMDDNNLSNCPLDYCCFGSSKDTYAVYAKGEPNRAKKLFDDKDEANLYSKNLSGSYVKVRPSKRIRCESYCSVNSFCNTYKEYVDANTKV